MRVKWLMVLGICVLIAPPVLAWHAQGRVFCDENGNGIYDAGDTPLAGVKVIVLADDGEVFRGTTDSVGVYYINVRDSNECYTLWLDPSTLPADAIVLSPNGGFTRFCLRGKTTWINTEWVVDCDGDTELGCWLTGGGNKFVKDLKMKMGESGPAHTWGGNVYPSCDPRPGDGGNWNHVAHHEDLHFKGTSIQVVRCGNVAGIDPGSESPVTPFNFIEFKGTGTLVGIGKNTVDHGTVHFWARVEDRNEPGNASATAGANIDRYFLHVFSDLSDPVGSTLLLCDEDGNAATVDPKTVTGGNMQLHISSCDDPPN
ncbi:MAG: hypothetical protein OER88_07825 [Planctomycetota bacterium]|nr:hypothetical protein [Planctomycetota bacterium]